MSKRIKVNSRVSTEAWRFDQIQANDVDTNRWSYMHFGEGWRDARVYGIVKEKSGQKWRIKWDIDGEITEFETDILHKENDLPKQGKQLLMFLFPLFFFSI